MTGTAETAGLEALYADMTSVDRVLQALTKEGLDIEHLRAADLYERGLDCQNLGAYPMLLTIATAAAEHRPLETNDPVLDIGCGMGGPGRFLADRYASNVTSIDVLPLRIDAAQALTTRTDLSDRISYQVATGTELPFDDATFAQAWMLDVSVHIEDKQSLFTQIARVLEPGGLLVMHDQTGPLPAAMEPATRGAPFIAPSRSDLINHIEQAGLRLLHWQDTTRHIIYYFHEIQTNLDRAQAAYDDKPRPWREIARLTAHAYLETLEHHPSRTGILIAQRHHPTVEQAGDGALR